MKDPQKIPSLPVVLLLFAALCEAIYFVGLLVMR